MPLGMPTKKAVHTPRDQAGQGNVYEEQHNLIISPSEPVLRGKADQSVAGSKVFSKPMIGKKNK